VFLTHYRYPKPYLFLSLFSVALESNIWRALGQLVLLVCFGMRWCDVWYERRMFGVVGMQLVTAV